MTTTTDSAPSRLLVTPRFERYLAANPNVLVSEKIADFVKSELTTPQRNRRMTFSASARGACPREQIFQFTSAKPMPRMDSDLHSWFIHGTFTHLKWQVLLLDAGILWLPEYSCTWDKWNMSGTIDGIGIPEENQLSMFDWGQTTLTSDPVFGWELKSANQRSYAWVCDKGPNHHHLLQIHAYMLATGLRVWSLVYENKNDQQWKEFVVTFDQRIADEVEAELHYLNDSLEQRQLPPVLSDCKQKKGPFKRCQFAHVCLDTKDWPERVVRMK